MSSTNQVHRARALLVAAALPVVLALGACGGSSAGTAPAVSLGSPATSLPPAASTAAAAVVPAALPAEVDVSKAADLQAAGAFVLDVREPDEWAAGHIELATLIPLGQLPARLAEVPKDRQVVVVCHSGNRSAMGRDILLGAGYPGVTSMAGGMTAWTAAGGPIVTGR